MKTILTHRLRSIISTVFLGLILVANPASVSAAISVNITTSLAPSTVIVGNTTVLSINVNIGSGVTDGGQVRVIYDPTKLEYLTVDYAGTPFDANSPNYAAGAGYVVISRYTNTPPGPTGSFLFAKLNFKALAQSGTSPVTIEQSASFFGDRNDGGKKNYPASVSGSTVTFQAAPAAPVTPPSTGSGSSGSGSTTPAKTTTPSKTTTTNTGTTTTTTPATTTTETPTDPAPTVTTATTPEGDPVPAVPLSKKIDKKLAGIAFGTLAGVLLIAAALTAIRKRNLGGVVGGSSHVILNQPSAPTLPVESPINKIPSVETHAPGEVVQPHPIDDNTPTAPPVA